MQCNYQFFSITFASSDVQFNEDEKKALNEYMKLARFETSRSCRSILNKICLLSLTIILKHSVISSIVNVSLKYQIHMNIFITIDFKMKNM